MTSLTDKIRKLRKDTPNEFDIGSERSTPRIIRDNGFNHGLDAAAALAKAEEALVKHPLPTVLTDEQMRPGQEIEQYLRTHGYLPEDGCCDTKPVRAVKEDWEAKFEHKFVEVDEIGAHIYESGNVKGIIEFIRDLLAAKDMEIAEAYKKGFINQGLTK